MDEWLGRRSDQRWGMAVLAVLWLLLGPPDRGDDPVWIIRGGYENRTTCESFRARNPNPHWLLCATFGAPGAGPGGAVADEPYPGVSGFRSFPAGALQRLHPADAPAGRDAVIPPR